MGLFDGWGETLSGITDAVVDGSEKYIDSWFASESDKVKSAAPEENRPTVAQSVQPDGQPVGYMLPPMRENLALYLGGGLLLLVAAKVLLK